MKFLDPNHPFFARAWVRWATAVLPVLWAGVEFINDNPGWGVLFAGAGAYAFWMLIVRGPDQG